MGKHGASLGADIYELWSAGHGLLPKVADQFAEAYGHTPGSVSWQCARSGPLGIGPNGPGAALDAMLDQLDKATSTTEKNLRSVGEAMVSVANDFAKTDAAAAAEFHRKQQTLGDGS